MVTGKVKAQPQKEILNGVKIYRTSLFTLTNLSGSPLFYSLTLLPFIFLKSAQLIKREKINFLHCNGFLSGLLGFLLSRIYRTPYIITVQRMETKKGFLRKMVYRRAICCIAASRAVENYFREIGSKNVVVIPNGIDISRFANLSKQASRQKLDLRDGFCVMTVARLEKVKGVDCLIKAASILKNGPVPIFLIIGDGSQRKNLERLVKQLGLQEKVRFLGEIENEKIPAYLAAADCFCLPSRQEGFGIAVLEAQASGVPVVASSIGGIIDLIETEKTGILVPPGSPEQIARAIKRIQDEPELARQLVKNAQQSLGKYNWDNIAERVYDIYSYYLQHSH